VGSPVRIVHIIKHDVAMYKDETYSIFQYL